MTVVLVSVQVVSGLGKLAEEGLQEVSTVLIDYADSTLSAAIITCPNGGRCSCVPAVVP